MSQKNESGIRFLKIVLAAGGGYEAMMGLAMFFFIQVFFGLLGADKQINYLIYPRSMGVLAVAFGLLMLGAARDPERYILIPLVSIVLRVAIQAPIVWGCFEMPSIALPLIGFGAFDIAFAALTAHAIRRSGIDWKNF